MNLIVWPETSRAQSEIGRKAASLLSLGQAGWSIPPWFVVLPDACWLIRTSANSDGTEFLDSGPSDELRRAIQAALEQLCPNQETVAVRSSASDEDGRDYSFAGQLDSFLSVPADMVLDRMAAVWRSSYSTRISAYRQRFSDAPMLKLPAIVVQRMVRADVAGIAFSADPVTGRRSVSVISAVRGLGAALASGESSGETWKIDREGKIISHNASAELGLPEESAGSAAGVQPVLEKSQVCALAQLARNVERHFGCAQDIEWAIEQGTIYLLQARPITTLKDRVDPDSDLGIWDNSNITESYSGVTTPLTFTFARRAYEGVYRQFCQLLAVSPAKIQAHQTTFPRMLGLIRGRVYYNLLNWYRVLALLPGFTVNRRFMEQMMGVKEPLPAEVLGQLEHATWQDRLRDLGRLALMGSKIVRHCVRLPTTVQRFHARLSEALQPPHIPLEAQRSDELIGYFQDLERKLLTRWDAPLLNDFFTMIFCGVLRSLAQKWCPSDDAGLVPSLLCRHGATISAEPVRRIRALARLAQAHPELLRQLREEPLGRIREAIEHAPDFAAAFQAYLNDFGDRCLDELKLESPTLQEDPLPLLRSVARMAALPDPPPSERGALDQGPAAKAEARVAQQLRHHPLRRALFYAVLRQARARVRDRENLRFERTRLFGRVRQVMLEVGRRFTAEGYLEDPRDIFYLELDEILGFYDGTASLTDLDALARLRRSQYEQFRREPVLPNRLTTRGTPYQGRPSLNVSSPVAGTSGDSRQGIGCCPGVVRGIARVVRDPHEARLSAGEILIARSTDPGWILLFPAASAVLVERGSLLSHSAIVARELRIPTVVSIDGLLDWVQDGEWLEVDGGTGHVRRVSPPAKSPAISDLPRDRAGLAADCYAH